MNAKDTAALFVKMEIQEKLLVHLLRRSGSGDFQDILYDLTLLRDRLQEADAQPSADVVSASLQNIGDMLTR